MKRRLNVSTLMVCLIVLGLLAVLPQTARACGYYCNLVSTDPFCSRCEYSGDMGGGCVQTSACGCYEVVCPIWSGVGPEEAAAGGPGFMTPEAQPAGACTDAPATALVAG